VFKCLECGKKFQTVRAAERASYNGCPNCNGVDIDIDPEPVRVNRNRKTEDRRVPKLRAPE
jgi:predicted  nucleic acid-binding Zn-ribbon protein